MDDAANGVKLPWPMHQSRGLHKAPAIQEVIRRLERVRGNKEAIIRELGRLRDEIASGSFDFAE